VSFVHVSNALGTINPAKQIIAAAHERGARVLLDAAQSAPHIGVDVQDLGCDFLVFSGHKLCGPTGIGVLYGRRELLDAMPPYQGGGDMIRSVSFEKTSFREVPERFEAGTPNVAGTIGLGAAIDYVGALDCPAWPPGSTRCSNTPPSSSATYPACASSAARPTKPACSPSCSKASTRMTSAPSSMPTASPSARATTARSPSCATSACRARRGPPSLSTTPMRVERLAVGIRRS
jgi:hypothetical protein